jgi:hypothetical protein
VIREAVELFEFDWAVHSDTEWRVAPVPTSSGPFDLRLSDGTDHAATFTFN